MVVRPSGGFHGTIGGGALEWSALEAALAALKTGRGPACAALARARPRTRAMLRRQGRLANRDLRPPRRGRPFRARLGRAGGRPVADRAHRRRRQGRTPARPRASGRGLTERLPDGETWTEPLGASACAVYLFGAGHVGRALALALAPLPFAVRWINSRREAFPARAPANVALFHVPEPALQLDAAPDGALIVVMTHSHAIDLDIVAAALNAERFGYVGLIGSETKRARFLRQMRDAGLTEAMLARLVCPIGLAGIARQGPFGDRRLDGGAVADGGGAAERRETLIGR